MLPMMTWTLAQVEVEAPVETDGPPQDQAPAQAGSPDGNAAEVGPVTQQDGSTTDLPLADGETGGGGGAGGIEMFWLVMIGVLILMFVLSTLRQRKDQKHRQHMLNELSKGDEVQTIGGERGKVVELRDDEVVLKVDENSNTRIRFARAAIQSVLTDDKKD